MRIGMLTPPFCAVPPSGYGGVQSHIHHLILALIDAGHEVILFSSKDSSCPATEIHYWYDIATDNPSGKVVPEIVQVLSGHKNLRDVELIHDHTFTGPHISPIVSSCSVVTTYCDVGDSQRNAIYSSLPKSVRARVLSPNAFCYSAHVAQLQSRSHETNPFKPLCAPKLV